MMTGKRTWAVKLVDFGSAVRLGRESVTMPRVKPSPLVAAPELLQGGHVSTLSDVWGAGLTLFILYPPFFLLGTWTGRTGVGLRMSGYHPWILDAEDAEEGKLRKAVMEEKLDLNMLFSNASQEALRFLTWALCKEPGRRMRPVEALEHRWLAPHEAMARRRAHINFNGNRLRTWSSSSYSPSPSSLPFLTASVPSQGPRDGGADAEDDEQPAPFRVRRLSPPPSHLPPHSAPPAPFDPARTAASHPPRPLSASSHLMQ